MDWLLVYGKNAIKSSGYFVYYKIILIFNRILECTTLPKIHIANVVPFLPFSIVLYAIHSHR